MLGGLFGLVLAVTVGHTAVAQDSSDSEDQRARELYENGAILYEEGRYEDAITAWQEAWDLSHRPLLLFNIANAQERIGLWREALDTLNRYRAYAKADERERLDRRINNLERRIAESGGSSEPLPGAQPERERGRIAWAPIALYAGGAAAVGTGTIFAFRASSARSEADTLCVEASDGLLCPSGASDVLRRDRVSSVVADIGFVVGGLAVIGGTVIVLTDGVSLAPTPGGLSLQGSF